MRRFRDIGRGVPRSLDLLEHSKHVPVLPGFNNQRGGHAQNGDAAHLNGFAGWWNAQAVPGMTGCAHPPDNELIALGNCVLYIDMAIGERRLQPVVKLVKRPRAGCDVRAIMQYSVDW